MVAERWFDGAVRVDLKAKAESQMAEARRIEVTASRNFQMRQQFLEDELKFNAQDLEVTEHSLDEAQGQLTTDIADLKMTEDALAEDTAALEDTMRDCQAKAVEVGTAINGRSGELDAYAKARAVISQKTGGAESFSHGLTQTSFLQLSRSVRSPSGGLTKFEAVWKTKELAKNKHSLESAQLASRVASEMHAETSTGDVITHVSHVVHTVEVERPRIIKQTVQKPIIQEKINQVTKHTSGDEQINLKEYVDRMKEGQNDIYCITGESIAMVFSSSFLENVHQFKESDGTKLNPTTKERLDPGGQDEKKAFEELVKEALGDKVDEVIVSNRMIDSLRVLTMSEQGLSVNMKRIMKAPVSLDSSTDLASGSQQRDSSQQPQMARQSTRQEKKERKGEGERGRSEREEEGREERESVREGQRGRGQEGRKEVRENEEGGSKVVKDVTGWTVVTRNKRQRKTVQIFVKMDGGKTSAMEMEMNDKVDDILKKIPISDQDVYVTSGGRILRRSDKLKSCEVREGSTVEVMSRMRGGGRHKDKKSKSEKKQTKNPETPEQKCDGESRSDEGSEMIPMDEAKRRLEENEEYLKILDCTSEENEEEVQQKVQNYLACMQKVSWMTKEQFEHLEKGVWQVVEARRKGMDEDQEQRRQAQQGQEQSKQGKQVRFGDEQQLGKTGAENAGEPEVLRKTTEVRTGRGNTGLVRGGDERCQADETSRKGKGKGNGGKGEHEGKGGGFGHKGKHPEGAGGSHPQAMSDPRKKKETRGLRWADCNDEEGKENEEEVEEEKEVGATGDDG